MGNLPDNITNDQALKGYVKDMVPRSREIMSQEDFWIDAEAQLKIVFGVRRWVASICNYSGPKLLCPSVKREEATEITRRLMNYECGLWCGGVSTYFSEILRLLGFPAGNLIYQYREPELANLEHATTIVGIQKRVGPLGHDYEFYNIDAYLCYHFVDRESGSLLTFHELLSRIVTKRHSTIKRIDERIERALLTPPGHDPAFRAWLFDGEMPESKTLPNGIILTPGATHSVDKLFPPGSPMWTLAQKVIGDRSMDEWLLDWMLVNPWIEEMGPPCRSHYCLAHVVVTREMIAALAKGLGR